MQNIYLAHHGILGQRWGFRRFQNYDGTRTNLGKAKEREHTVFVSGSSKTQTEDSGYYRKALPKEIQNELNRHMDLGDKIIVGDAPGIDRQVQDYLNELRYPNVEVYGPGTEVRYSANKKWKTNPIDAPEFEPGSKDWLAKKDIAMTEAADEGLAIVLDEGAKATRKNVERLISENKGVKVYELNKGGIDLDRWIEHDDLKNDPHKYGLPDQKKFPMPDADHVRSAIRFFNYAAPKDEEKLAKAILRRMKEYGLTFDDFTVGDENRFKKYIPESHLEHHGILGQRWGVRRYQNPDGTLTAAGRRRLQRQAARIEKKDAKWARKNYDKIYNKAYKKGKRELNDYLVNDLNRRVKMKNSDGKISLTYANEYNRKLAEVMNKNVGDIRAPSGKVVQYIAKRGSVGVHMALVDQNNFDMSSVRRGVYGDGRVAYRQDKVARA